MPGMPGMKDTVVRKPSPTRKTKPAVPKKATTRKAVAKPAAQLDSTATTQHDSTMSMPMTAHDSTSAHDSMPGMAPMPAPIRDSTAMHGMASMSGTTSPAGMKPMTADDMMIGPVGISMERMGSGTTWIPDAVTMPSRRTMMGSWMVMAHGFAFAQYDHQSGKRGDDQFGSLNWAMLMATRELAGGRFQARTMLSLDALTVTSKGYPLLLQTGETYDGQPLHDRQHPHDFFMELGALYQRQLTPTLGWSVYAAPSGEPALGPVAFMHRPSAMDNPSAPISHHWQDATHVSFGVLTGGLFTKTFQIEASAFNGREPDQHRWNFDPIKIDSYSSRVTFNPNAAWSVSGGYGYLKSPEALNPKMSMHRVTASILNGKRIGSDGQVATSVIWGANKHSGESGLSHSFLAESEAILDRSNTIFGRTEWVQKSGEDLVVDAGSTGLPSGASAFPSAERFNVSTAQLGYIRELGRTHWATIGLGAAGTINFVPSQLEPIYGSRTPAGLFVFLRLRPFHERALKESMTTMGHE
ncbi:MAG: hypothetical protein M3Z17_05215 [Gemmatimonadota bacterium]|nr:hypothetical protein [Gemmatimonadota bacterium]